MINADILAPIEAWFAQQNWTPQAFQHQTWRAYLDGHSGLVQVPTGAGKTYAAYMAPLAELHAQLKGHARKADGLRILYISPLRAMTRDLELALRRPIEAQNWPYTVDARTGDTSAYRRKKQRDAMPHILITTPESLSILLSYQNSHQIFASLRAVIVDEWHELMASKRGVQTELALAALRTFAPDLRTWALSATVGNIDQAAQTVVGAGRAYQIIRADIHRPIHIETLLPDQIDAFPWAGHLGLHMIQQLLERLDIERSTLLFTNTRNQAERWYQALLFYRPEWKTQIALHHSAIDKADRALIEAGLKSGAVRLTVCTASLDLGVDFAPVEQIIQIGSVKGIARLIQRAGRSGHRPGETSRILFVPTHALELLEISAIRQALREGDIEDRRVPEKPYDVLSQHLVTRAAGSGYTRDQMYAEATATQSYRNLTKPEFNRLLRFVEHGGDTLKAYPQYHKITQIDDRYTVTDDRLARLHRFNIGAITSDVSIKLAYQNGATVGHIEEYFIARLKPGDVFVFAGKKLAFQKLRGLTAYVKKATKNTTLTPAWMGGKLPISPSLSHYLRLSLTRLDDRNEAELQTLQPIIQAQQELSALPAEHQLLVECTQTREGRHLFIYPFEGSLVHEGLAAIIAFRLSNRHPATFSLSVNDYGLELLGPKNYPFQDHLTPDIFQIDQLETDIRNGMNLGELQKRQFRDIAQIAGLVFKAYPGNPKTGKQLQTSSGLLYDVFSQHDPDHLLLQQAEQEVLDGQLERRRLNQTLSRLAGMDLLWQTPPRPTPFAFPLLIERLAARLSNESLRDRIERIKNEWSRQ